MRKLILAFAFLLAGAVNAFGQSTTVSGTVTDAGSQAWAGGTYRFSFQPNPQFPTGPYTWTGGTLTMVITGSLDGSGHYSVSIPSNTAISPQGSTWILQVTPNASSPGFATPRTTITGGTQTLNVTPPAILIPWSNPPGPAISAYADAEIGGTLVPGAEYFNTTSLVTRVWNGTSWQNQGSGAGVTSVTASNPLASSGGATPNITAPQVVGPVFNAALQFGAVGDGSTNNATAFAAAATAINAYAQASVGGSLQQPPTLYIPYGVYNYSSGLAFTKPFTLRCEQGTLLNYTGSAHAVDFGPSGLTSGTLQQGLYSVENCGFTGGATMTEGLFFNQYITNVRVRQSVFLNFGPATSTVYGIWLDGFNFQTEIAQNHVFNNDNAAHNFTKVHAQDVNTQLAFHDNQLANVDGAFATTCGTVSGVGVFSDGIRSDIVNNNFACGWGPSIILGPNSHQSVITQNYYESLPSGATIPAIQFSGTISGLTISTAYYNAHGGTTDFFMGPLDGSSTLVNTTIASIYTEGYSPAEVVNLNNIAGQTGNSYKDIYVNDSPVPTFHNTAGNIAPWTCLNTCGSGDLGTYLDQNAGLALFGTNENTVVGSQGLITQSAYNFTSAIGTGPDSGISRAAAKTFAFGSTSLGDASGQLNFAISNQTPTTVTGLGAAAAGNKGFMRVVSDSTTVSAEGQACVGSSTHTALAFSDGTTWKCF